MAESATPSKPESSGDVPVSSVPTTTPTATSTTGDQAAKPTELKETEVEINGLTHTLLLDEEGVKRAEAAKAAAAPATKSATPENK